MRTTTHWGQHQDLHPGTLDDCEHPDCDTRRHLVDEHGRRNRRPLDDSPGERGELEPVG